MRNRLSFRHKRAGATYYIDFEVTVNRVEKAKVLNFSIKQSQYEKYFPEKGYSRFEADVELLLNVDIEEASSYDYGIEEPIRNTPLLVRKVRGSIPDSDEEGWEPTKENIQKCLEDIFKVNSDKMSLTKGMGWTGRFTGEVENYTLDYTVAPDEGWDGYGGIDTLADISFTNEAVVDDIEYQCSGQYYYDRENDDEDDEYESSKKASNAKFEGVYYAFSNGGVDVYAFLKGSDQKILLATFDRKPNGLSMTYPDGKAYSGHFIRVPNLTADMMMEHSFRTRIEKLLDNYFDKYLKELEAETLRRLRYRTSDLKGSCNRDTHTLVGN